MKNLNNLIRKHLDIVTIRTLHEKDGTHKGEERFLSFRCRVKQRLMDRIIQECQENDFCIPTMNGFRLIQDTEGDLLFVNILIDRRLQKVYITYRSINIFKKTNVETELEYNRHKLEKLLTVS